MSLNVAPQTKTAAEYAQIFERERLMDRLSQFFRYMTASISARDNGTLMRVTLTLGQ